MRVKFLTLITINLMLFMMSNSLIATNIFENFDGGYDSSTFTLTNSDPDSSFSVSGDKLWFHGWEYSGGSTDQRGGFFTTQTKLYGDFIATADLSGFNAPFDGGGKFVLASIYASGENSEIARIGRVKGYAANNDGVKVKINTGTAYLESNSSSGAMKLERIGTTMNAYWDDTLVYSRFFGDTPVTIGLLANRWGTVSYFDAAFDDFTIIPEPTTLILFGLGCLTLKGIKNGIGT